jgi:hypothetical protein
MLKIVFLNQKEYLKKVVKSSAKTMLCKILKTMKSGQKRKSKKMRKWIMRTSILVCSPTIKFKEEIMRVIQLQQL